MSFGDIGKNWRNAYVCLIKHTEPRKCAVKQGYYLQGRLILICQDGLQPEIQAEILQQKRQSVVCSRTLMLPQSRILVIFNTVFYFSSNVIWHYICIYSWNKLKLLVTCKLVQYFKLIICVCILFSVCTCYLFLVILLTFSVVPSGVHERKTTTGTPEGIHICTILNVFLFALCQ